MWKVIGEELSEFFFIETIAKQTDKFIDLFIKDIQSLKLHDFVAKQ